MCSARSSVDDAASMSPRASSVCACATSERVAGDKWFSRTGAGGRGAGAGALGGGRLDGDAPVAGGLGTGGLGNDGRGVGAGQPLSNTAAAVNARASLVSE